MKNARKLLALAVVSFAATSVHAEGSYLGMGLGLQFDLGSLASTITKDGLDSTKYHNATASLTPADLSALQGAIGPAASDAFFRSVAAAKTSALQKMIVPENELLIAQNSGILSAKTSGPMHGLVLSLFWEKENQDTFWRVGVSYTRKALGGSTEATFAGYKMIDYNWSFESWIIPAYYGIKAGVGESTSVYGALGINYHRGGWGLEGTSDGQLAYEVGTVAGIPLNIGPHVNKCIYLDSCPRGARSSLTHEDGQGLNGGMPVWGEKIKFDVAGLGFNFLVGVERKLQSGNKMYFEIEHIVAGGYDTSPARAPGTAVNMNATLAYPINLGGTRYNFGYKIAM
jgi:hypothetical protein